MTAVLLMNSNIKPEAVKAEQKPVTTAADDCAQQLLNHQRQVLEPKAITSSENKVVFLTVCNTQFICIVSYTVRNFVVVVVADNVTLHVY